MKILLPRFASKAKVRARFAAEARAMAMLEHPNIVRVYDVETEAALPYLVMELVPSGSLANWLETYGAFPPRQALGVVLQICAGADAAHAANIVHRDIKPQNVLVDATGVCKLTDFGIARFEESHQTRMGAALGTEGYMAPEQARDASTADVRSDVYGIGMTLFVLVTANDPVEWLSGRGGTQVPPPIREVLELATAPNPDDRFPDIAGLIDALRWAWDELPPDAVELPLGDALPVRSVDTEDSPESYVDVTGILDPPSMEVPTLGPPPPARTSQSNDGYRVSLSESTPDYVDKEAKAPAPRPFVVGLDPGDLRSVEPVSEESVERGPLETALRWLFHPLQLLPLVVGCGLLAIAYGAWENLSAMQAVEDVRLSREHLYGELTSQRPLLESVGTLGGDRVALEASYSAWYAARTEPERFTAAERFVEGLAAETERIAAPGTGSWEDLSDRVRRLRSARDGYARSLELATQSTDSRWVIATRVP